LALSDLPTMTNETLKSQLQERGLLRGGNRQDLLERLEDWIKERDQPGSVIKVPCTKLCRKGRKTKTLCPNKRSGRLRRQSGDKTILSCVEVERLLTQMEVDLSKVSRCILASIQSGRIVVSGHKDDLEKVIFVGDCLFCSSKIDVKLKAVLYQGDDSCGTDYDAKVECPNCEQKERAKREADENYRGQHVSKFYLAGLCNGDWPRLDDGHGYVHCTKCPGYGACLRDWAEEHCSGCGGHERWGACYTPKCPNKNEGRMANFFC